VKPLLLLAVDVSYSSKIIRRGDTFSLYVDITNGYSDEIVIMNVPITAPIGFKPVKHPGKRTGGREITIQGAIKSVAGPIKMEPDLTLIPIKSYTDLPFTIQPRETFRVEHFLTAGKRLDFKPRADTYTISCCIEFGRKIAAKTEGAVTVTNQPSEKSKKPNPSTTSVRDIKSQYAENIEISIFPSLAGMLAGTLIGSVLGALIRSNFDLRGASLVSVIASMVFGFMTGIILMRKKDVQTFITIEDIWGGILIGFFIGFYGKELFERIANISPLLGPPSTHPSSPISTSQLSNLTSQLSNLTTPR
jgi:hypothetical protein